MSNTLKPLITILTTTLMVTAAVAAIPDPFERDDGYPSFTGDFKDVNGMLINRCLLDEDSTINFCDPKKAAIIKKMVDRKPTFSKNSVLMRFWDKETSSYTYAAYNQKTKKMFFYPAGLSAINPPYKNVKMTYGKNKDMLCTSGANIEMVGDRYSKSFSDREADVDYCRTYNESTGFGEIKRVDSKTRKPAKLDDFKL